MQFLQYNDPRFGLGIRGASRKLEYLLPKDFKALCLRKDKEGGKRAGGGAPAVPAANPFVVTRKGENESPGRGAEVPRSRVQ